MTVGAVDRVISVDSIYGLAPYLQAAASNTAWQYANRARYIGFQVWDEFTFDRIMTVNGTPVSGNFDVGVYDKDGNLLVSSGSTAQSGASAAQVVSVTATTLSAGFYYFGMASDDGTGQYTVFDSACQPAFYESSAFPLASSVSLSTRENRIPWIGIIREGM